MAYKTHRAITKNFRCPSVFGHRGAFLLGILQALALSPLSLRLNVRLGLLRCTTTKLREWQQWAALEGGPQILDFNVLGDGQCILKLNAQITHCTIHFRMA